MNPMESETISEMVTEKVYPHGGDFIRYPGMTLDFSVNTNPLGMPKSAKEALFEAADSFDRYPDDGCTALREVLSEKTQLPPEAILCGNGAADLIFRICACFQPKRALVLAPTFGEYERCIRLFGGTAVPVRLSEEREFALGTETLDLLESGIDAFFLCNPNNPTGCLADPELLEEIAAICKKKNILLVVDECFLEFTEGQSMISLLPRNLHLLVLNAFTKFYSLAGLRLGYLFGDARLLREVKKFGPQWSVSAAAQAAGIGALKDRTWNRKTMEAVRAERRYLSEALEKLGLRVFRSDADFLLLKSSLPLFEPLLKKRILVRDGADFSGLDEHFIRISVHTHEENVRLVSAIGEVLHG